MNYSLIFDNNVFSIPKSVLNAIPNATGHELAVLLLFVGDTSLPTETEAKISALAERAECSAQEVRAALQFWRGAGILKMTKNPPKASAPREKTEAQEITQATENAEKSGTASVKPDTEATAPGEQNGNSPDSEGKPKKKPVLPSRDEVYVYSGDEMEQLLQENNGARRCLIDECQALCGKVFNTLEINKLLYLSETLSLSQEYILMLFAYCAQKGKRSVHYIERAAVNLQNEGVDDLAKLEAYFKKKEAFESYEGKIRTAFGLGARVLTQKEKHFLSDWKDNLLMPIETVLFAYEICVNATGDVSFPYINSILSRWNAEGIHTPEQAEQDTRKRQQQSMQQGKETPSFDTDAFLELALKRSQAVAETIPDHTDAS